MHSFPAFLCLCLFFFPTGNVECVLGFMGMLGSHQAAVLLNLARLLLWEKLPSAYRHTRRHVAPHCAQQGDKFNPASQVKQAQRVTYHKQVEFISITQPSVGPERSDPFVTLANYFWVNF